MSLADFVLPENAILRAVRESGPVSVAHYMAQCVRGASGRYITGAPVGAAGDFITAPEISQLFGELIGAWAYGAWQTMGAPPAVALIELGPGRGTLLGDALRVAARRNDFAAAITVHCVELSPALREAQRARIAWPRLAWHDTLRQVSDGPAILIANEFVDCLPVEQAVMTGAGWCMRQVEWRGGGLAFGLGAAPKCALPPDAPVSSVAEWRPEADALLALLAERHGPQAALIVDYGHGGGFGDTLQAVAHHLRVDPLMQPGSADLSAHVDFGALATAARSVGLSAHGPLPQGRFLLALGLAARLEALVHSAPARGTALAEGAARLVGPAQMGDLFKALCIVSAGLAAPFPFGGGDA